MTLLSYLLVCCLRYCRMSITVFCADVWNCHGPFFSGHISTVIHNMPVVEHAWIVILSVSAHLRGSAMLSPRPSLVHMCSCDLTTLIEQHIFCTHFYADDTQVYGSSRPSATYDIRQHQSAFTCTQLDAIQPSLAKHQ